MLGVDPDAGGVVVVGGDTVRRCWWRLRWIASIFPGLWGVVKDTAEDRDQRAQRRELDRLWDNR